MIIAILFLISRLVETYALAIATPFMVIVITLAVIVMLFGAVGMKISNNLGATILGGIFRTMGYIFRSVVRLAKWIGHQLPKVFVRTKKVLIQKGVNHVLSMVIAILVVLIII